MGAEHVNQHTQAETSCCDTWICAGLLKWRWWMWSNIVTNTDETWIHIQAGVSAVVAFVILRPNKKTFSEEAHCYRFLGQKGVLLVEFCDHRITVNADM